VYPRRDAHNRKRLCRRIHPLWRATHPMFYYEIGSS